jgi:hypothetical protein
MPTLGTTASGAGSEAPAAYARKIEELRRAIQIGIEALERRELHGGR